jgi:hypothetical protein
VESPRETTKKSFSRFAGGFADPFGDPGVDPGGFLRGKAARIGQDEEQGRVFLKSFQQRWFLPVRKNGNIVHRLRARGVVVQHHDLFPEAGQCLFQHGFRGRIVRCGERA